MVIMQMTERGCGGGGGGGCGRGLEEEKHPNPKEYKSWLPHLNDCMWKPHEEPIPCLRVYINIYIERERGPAHTPWSVVCLYNLPKFHLLFASFPRLYREDWWVDVFWKQTVALFRERKRKEEKEKGKNQQ